MIITSNRASAVLCKYLYGKQFKKPFLLPANVCPVLPLTMMKAGVDFQFVDIDDTHAMSKGDALDKLKSGEFAGLVFVHSYGKLFDNTSFYEKIKRYDPQICIIDDRCLCQPDLTGDQPEYTDLALYSTGYAKYVELSFGGYGITDAAMLSSPAYEFSEEQEIKQQVYIKECLREGKGYELSEDYPWLDCSSLQLSVDQYFDVIRKKLCVVQKHKERINKIYREGIPKNIQFSGGGV